MTMSFALAKTQNDLVMAHGHMVTCRFCLLAVDHQWIHIEEVTTKRSPVPYARYYEDTAATENPILVALTLIY
jgi:hypothetical protein